MRKISVSPVCGEGFPLAKYDIAVAACGFETRCRFFFETCQISSERFFATDYGHRQRVAYHDNRDWFAEKNFELVIGDESRFVSGFLGIVDELCLDRGYLRVLVDISGFTRARLASLLECMWNRTDVSFEVDWVYSLAEYYSPPSEISINQVGPVSPLFAGWTDAPELPTSAVFGLGFEPGKVLGAVEYLESGDVFACVPDGPDERFKNSVLEANLALLSELGEGRVMTYRIGSPFNTFVWIEGMCAGLLRRSRLVLIPFGPKIFALNCMLAALVHSPHVMVLRVSGFGTVDRDVKASGQVYKIRSCIQSVDVIGA